MTESRLLYDLGANGSFQMLVEMFTHFTEGVGWLLLRMTGSHGLAEKYYRHAFLQLDRVESLKYP
jgi:hypothetical protein